MLQGHTLKEFAKIGKFSRKININMMKI